MKFGEKLKKIREAENLSQSKMAEALSLSIDSLRNYEQERRKITEENLMKITKNPQFQKYTMWLMCDLTAEELPTGQVCPELVKEIDKKQSA